MSTTPPEDPTGTPGSTPPPPSGPEYGAPPPSGPEYGAPPPSGPDYGGTTPPPPPAGGYSTPPPGGGYGPPPGGPDGPSDWSIGKALGYGFEKFTQNLGQILLLALLLLVASGIAFGISIPIRTGFNNGDSNLFVTDVASSISQFVYTVLVWIVQAAIIRGALDITEGRRFEVSKIFTRLPIGKVILASLLVALITAVGTILCVLPGIIAWFLLLFTPFFVVDQLMSPIAAIKASFRMTVDNLASMILWVIVGGIVYVAGYCVLCIGVLVTGPVVLIGATYTYKKFTGQPVAP